MAYTQEELAGIITFRDLVREIWAIIRYLTRRWYVILIIVALFSGSFFYYAKSDLPLFIAQLTFSVRGSEAGGGNTGVLAQLGINSGSSSSGLNLARLEGLATSRNIVREVLLRRVTVEEQTDFIANHIIDLYELREDAWEENQTLREFPGFTTDTIDFNDLTQNIVLKQLAGLLVKGSNSIITFIFDPISTIHTISVSTPNEQLSIALAGVLYEELDQLYVDNSVQQQQQTVRTLQMRSDSLDVRLRELEMAMANQQDRNRNLVLRSAQVSSSQLQRDVRIAQNMYAEVIKNLTAARFTLDNITPSFQVVDRPIAPLNKKSLPVMFFAMMGATVGLIVSVTLLVLFRAVARALDKV